MKDHYVFPTRAEAEACVEAINSSGWFPIVGNVQGIPAPQNTGTALWHDEPEELLTGEWAVPRIPTPKLDLIGVPQGDRDTFLAAFGQDIRTLSTEDFVQQPLEEI